MNKFDPPLDAEGLRLFSALRMDIVQQIRERVHPQFLYFVYKSGKQIVSKTTPRSKARPEPNSLLPNNFLFLDDRTNVGRKQTLPQLVMRDSLETHMFSSFSYFNVDVR